MEPEALQIGHSLSFNNYDAQIRLEKAEMCSIVYNPDPESVGSLASGTCQVSDPFLHMR
jgi:hypothetical protein